MKLKINYKNLIEVVPLLETVLKSNPSELYEVYANDIPPEKSGMMKLTFEGRYALKDGTFVISLSHTYLQWGDVMSDPFMEIRVDVTKKTAEGVYFEQHSPPLTVYSYDISNFKITGVNTRGKQANNDFLYQWLRNLVEQGYKIDLSEFVGKPVEEVAKEVEKYEFDSYKGLDFPYKNDFDRNRAIEEFLDANKHRKAIDFTDSEKSFIQLYEGYGSLEKKGAKASKGLLYEYYTPEILIRKMWGLAYKYGYNSGAILEPSVGTGRFLNYAPAGESVLGYEISPYSFRICQILHPYYDIRNEMFETYFYEGNTYNKDFRNPFSLVIGNPPYGDFAGKYAKVEGKRVKASKYDHYFIIRGLDVLEPGGLLVFVTSNSLFSGTYLSTKEEILKRAELLDAYLLPNKTFDKTTIGTSIIVLKKR